MTLSCNILYKKWSLYVKTITLYLSIFQFIYRNEMCIRIKSFNVNATHIFLFYSVQFLNSSTVHSVQCIFLFYSVSEYNVRKTGKFGCNNKRSFSTLLYLKTKMLRRWEDKKNEHYNFSFVLLSKLCKLCIFDYWLIVCFSVSRIYMCV